ncbi:MAG: 3-deoxy-manno-octulosonate-8-phosphatase KdsC [Gammaproteobacteria bacterium]|nr:3-deoxy-manno-octulosonate-8-phosphatase KdsC [Gammaproteobacteria bacterium]
MKFNLNESIVFNNASKINLLVLDVDGVLTDGRLYFSNAGEELKTFHTLDGHGIKMLQKSAIEVAIITGRSSTILERRASDLGIKILYQGREDKLTALNEILEDQIYTTKEVAYAGDDLPDLAPIKAVGLSFSVPNGHPEIKSAAHAITTAKGGLGAVREISDFILKAQNKYDPFYG